MSTPAASVSSWGWVTLPSKPQTNCWSTGSPLEVVLLILLSSPQGKIIHMLNWVSLVTGAEGKQGWGGAAVNRYLSPHFEPDYQCRAGRVWLPRQVHPPGRARVRRCGTDITQNHLPNTDKFTPGFPSLQRRLNQGIMWEVLFSPFPPCSHISFGLIFGIEVFCAAMIMGMNFKRIINFTLFFFFFGLTFSLSQKYFRSLET